MRCTCGVCVVYVWQMCGVRVAYVWRMCGVCFKVWVCVCRLVGEWLCVWVCGLLCFCGLVRKWLCVWVSGFVRESVCEWMC